jgi:Fe-S-cluster containining protein
MQIETSISRIETLTRAGEDEDRDYRRMLDKSGLSSEDIDAIVERHRQAVSGQIECTECGNCCKVFRPQLTRGDIHRLAKCLKITDEDFIAQYLIGYSDGTEYAFKITPCPFLVDNACTVYPDRPDQCRLYPDLHSPGFVSRLSRAFSNCSVCPIVYNVYQRVKQEITSSTQKIR